MGLSEVCTRDTCLYTKPASDLQEGEDAKGFSLGTYLRPDRIPVTSRYSSLSPEMVKFAEGGRNVEPFSMSPHSSMEDIVRDLLNEDSSSSDGDSLISGSRRCRESRRHGNYSPQSGSCWPGQPIRCNELGQVPMSVVAANYGLLVLDTASPPPYVGPAEPPTLLALGALHSSMDHPPPSPNYVMHPPHRDNSVDSGYTQSPVQRELADDHCLSDQASYCRGLGAGFPDAMHLGQGLSEVGIIYGQGLPNEEDLMNFVQQINANGNEVALSIAQLANDEHNRHQDTVPYNMDMNGHMGLLTPGVTCADAWVGGQASDIGSCQPTVQNSALPSSFVSFPQNLSSQLQASYKQQSNLRTVGALAEYPPCLANERDLIGSPVAALANALPPIAGRQLAAVYNPLVPPPATPRHVEPMPGAVRGAGRSPQAELHAALESCREQLRLLGEERERVQEELGICPGDEHLLRVTRKGSHGSRVDGLIPAHEREHNAVLALIIAMGKLYSVAIHDGIPNVLHRWDTAIGVVRKCRRKELENLNAGCDRSQGNKGVAALAESVQTLRDVCREVRTALWSVRTMTTILGPDKCGVPSAIHSTQ